MPGIHRRRGALLLVAALHLALLYGWSLARHPRRPAAPDDGRGAIQWLTFPAAPPRPAATIFIAPPARARVRATQVMRVAPVVAITPVTRQPPSTDALPATSSSEAPPVALPASSTVAPLDAGDILQQARRDIGKIDRDLRRQYHEPLAGAAPDTPQKRMERGFAAAAAPNRWYEAPRIIAMMDQGGRKIYKVVGAAGTYCVYADAGAGTGVRTATCPSE